MIAIPWYYKVGAALVLAVAIYGKGRYDGNQAQENAYMRETLQAQRKADALANELVIAQASAMATTEKKVVQYVDRIRTAAAPDVVCPVDPRNVIGSHGVRDILRGTDAPGGAPPSLPRPRTPN